MNTKLLSRPEFATAIGHFIKAVQASAAHSKAVGAALKKYGSHGPEISVISRDHFPAAVKDKLRDLALAVTRESDAAWAARPPRVRTPTMRALASAVANKYGSGFYGPQPTRKNPVRKNPSHEITELVLYAENTGPSSQGHEKALWNQRVSILANLKRKVKKGVYDSTLAAKLWGYWADSAAKSYNQIHGTGKYALTGSPFNATDRREAAKIFEANFRNEVHEGASGHDEYGEPMKNPKRNPRRVKAPKRSFSSGYFKVARLSGSNVVFWVSSGNWGTRAMAALFSSQKGAQMTAQSTGYRSAVVDTSIGTDAIKAALRGKR